MTRYYIQSKNWYDHRVKALDEYDDLLEDFDEKRILFFDAEEEAEEKLEKIKELYSRSEADFTIEEYTVIYEYKIEIRDKGYNSNFAQFNKSYEFDTKEELEENRDFCLNEALNELATIKDNELANTNTNEEEYEVEESYVAIDDVSEYEYDHETSYVRYSQYEGIKIVG